MRNLLIRILKTNVRPLFLHVKNKTVDRNSRLPLAYKVSPQIWSHVRLNPNGSDVGQNVAGLVVAVGCVTAFLAQICIARIVHHQKYIDWLLAGIQSAPGSTQSNRRRSGALPIGPR